MLQSSNLVPYKNIQSSIHLFTQQLDKDRGLVEKQEMGGGGWE